MAGLTTIGRPAAVLFDWDNTLVENWGSIRAALNHALAAHGQPPMSLEQVRHQGRHSARDIFPSLFGPDWQPARELFLAHLKEHHLAGIRVMPGAESVLDVLAESGVALAVVSNKNRELLRREIDHLGWAGRFRNVVASQDAAADKPDAAPLHMALESLGIVASGRVWMVGDTDIDMRAAIAAECLPILVGTIKDQPDLFADAKPVLIYADCHELAGFVRGLYDTICVGS